MKPRKALRLAVLLLVVVSLLSTWALVSAADGQTATVNIDPTATADKVGIATVGGSVDCAVAGTVSINGTLREPVGKTKTIEGPFHALVYCGPGATAYWFSQVIPTDGKFGGGWDYVTGTYVHSFQTPFSGGYYPPYPNCYLVYEYVWNGYYYYYVPSYWQCNVYGSFGPDTVKVSH